jgi:uncharacterized protein (TIGR02453 family)
MPKDKLSSSACFPEAGFRFLAQLKKHNDRDWFNERKAEYKSVVEQPMAELVHAVAAECRRRGLPLHAKDKNPVMRVYRDIRFSKDKLPFKTHVAAELRRSFGKSNSGLYLHFSPDESLLGAGIWQPERALLQAWREAIVDQPGRFAKIAAGLDRRGASLSTEGALSNMPRGFQSHLLETFAVWLKLTSFIAVQRLGKEECTAAGLLGRIVDFALAAKPLLEFGWEVEEKSHLSSV